MLDEIKRKEIIQSTDQIVNALDKVFDADTDHAYYMQVKNVVEKELEICMDMAYACRISEETEKVLMEQIHSIAGGSL